MSQFALAASKSPSSLPRERNDWINSTLLYLYGAAVLSAIFIPMAMLLIKSIQNSKGIYVGLENYEKYFQSTALFDSFYNSVLVSFLTAVIVVPTAFLYAYGLSRTCMRFKGIFRAGIFLPLLIPRSSKSDRFDLLIRESRDL